MQSQKTKIYISKDLCDAIMIEKKTTIRSSENLDYINTYPDGFSLKKIDFAAEKHTDTDDKTTRYDIEVEEKIRFFI